ncbi:MAG: bifunctional riboflavin kinase/FAD synthetase [Prevotella sp.]|nr:bifunctional riboflavin kinase/FAD synthetase [Bacteroides sp.]MCM1365754.1 bifunctional riboflavin kinase/FAD synthetase [Prevotella sp.]MCM1436424.1 bifunctional riboflavin kinase/FAD synthetase [Prevotella sp.]
MEFDCKCESDLNSLPIVATVGTFDGVHRGHLLVIERLLTAAKALNARPVVFTFDRHPLATIAPQRAPKRLMMSCDECESLKKHGVDVIVLQFDERLRCMTAAQWLSSLKHKYNVKELVMGYDNTFGSDGIYYSLSDYQKIGEECNVPVIVADRLDGVSSSIIRKALSEGNLDKARDALGRSYSISGKVTHGQALGRTIGFPTANLDVDPSLLLPRPGVYVAEANLDNGQTLPAVVNIGLRPTVSDKNNTTIEAHLINWSGDLYDSKLTLHFIERLRDEERFANLEALKTQIRKDIINAGRIFNCRK